MKPRSIHIDIAHRRRARYFALVVITLVASIAAASDDVATGSLPTIPDQVETANTASLDNAKDDSASGEPQPRLLDRRDRIFYPGDTERLKPLGRKLLLNILLDQEEIFTSPFRMNRHNAKWWLLSAAVTGGLIAADRHIADSFENSSGQVRWGGRVSNIGGSSTPIPIFARAHAYGVWRGTDKG